MPGANPGITTAPSTTTSTVAPGIPCISATVAVSWAPAAPGAAMVTAAASAVAASNLFMDGPFGAEGVALLPIGPVERMHSAFTSHTLRSDQ